MSILDRFLGSHPKSISIFRTSFPKFSKNYSIIVFLLLLKKQRLTRS